MKREILIFFFVHVCPISLLHSLPLTMVCPSPPPRSPLPPPLSRRLHHSWLVLANSSVLDEPLYDEPSFYRLVYGDASINTSAAIDKRYCNMNSLSLFQFKNEMLCYQRNLKEQTEREHKKDEWKWGEKKLYGYFASNWTAGGACRLIDGNRVSLYCSIKIATKGKRWNYIIGCSSAISFFFFFGTIIMYI